MRPFQHDEQATQKEFDEQVSLVNSIYWLKAVIEQGARIFEATEQSTVHVNSMIYNSREKMEEQFFLTACGKAQRWLDPLKLDMPEATNFSELFEDIKKVRDEREHDDDRYGLGNKFDLKEVDPCEHAERGYVLKASKPGKRPNPYQKFRMEKADTGGECTIFCSISVTAHSGKSILLGGIVDLTQVVKAAKMLLETLLQKQHAYWDRRLARMPGKNTENEKIAESYYIDRRFK